MISASIQVTDQATPLLHNIATAVKRPRALMAAAGKRVEKELRSHFLKKNQEGNKRGWPRSNFWTKRIRQATSFTGADDTSATVTIASPEFYHKLKGGRISAKRGKFLAIPLSARAKAAGSPREGGWRGNALTLTPTADGTKFVLRESLASRITRKGRGQITGGEAHYLLVKSVNQKADPTALPPDHAIQSAIDDEAQKYFAREAAR